MNTPLTPLSDAVYAFVGVYMWAPVCMRIRPHAAESWLTGKQPSFFLINQWYAREGGFRSRRWGVSVNKRCWWWSGCCIISASEHLSSPRQASAINCTKLENDIWGRIILSAVISKQKRQNGGKKINKRGLHWRGWVNMCFSWGFVFDYTSEMKE